MFAVGLLAGELLLTLGAKIFFQCANDASFSACMNPFATHDGVANIPAGLLHGLLPDLTAPGVAGEAVHARLVWIASVVLVVFVSVAATIFAVTTILKERSLPRGPTLAFLLVLIFVCALIAMRSDVSRELLEAAVLKPTIGSYRVGGFDLHAFAVVRQVANALISGATVAIVAALTVRAALGPALDVQAGRKLMAAARFADLRRLLIVGAALLVSVLVTMAAWLNWPTAGLPKDSEAWRLIVDIAEGVGLYWGLVFSLSLVLAYLPCVIWLRHLLAAQGPTDPAAGGTAQASIKVMQDVIALLSPFVSALLPLFFV